MPVSHHRIRLEGTLVGGEVWSTGCSFADPANTEAMDYADLDIWARRVGALNTNQIIGTFMKAALGTGSALTTVRAEDIGSDGRLRDVAEYVLPTPVTGSSTAKLPHQAAIVISLYTARPGRSYRGRMYWPALGQSLESAGLRVGNAAIAGIAGEAALLLDSIAGAGPSGWTLVPVVASQVQGRRTPVQNVRVGDVVDTQRRRRDTLAESYATAAIPSFTGTGSGGSF